MTHQLPSFATPALSSEGQNAQSGSQYILLEKFLKILKVMHMRSLKKNVVKLEMKNTKVQNPPHILHILRTMPMLMRRNWPCLAL